MSPFLEEYARSIGLRLAVAGRELAPKRRPLLVPYQQRQCFICGSWQACIHREPELLVMAEDDHADS